MDQPKQPRGNFYAPLNRYKQQGDNKPIFVGDVSKPEDEAKQPIALWAFRYERTNKETGEVTRHIGYSGAINGVAANIPAQDQIEALIGAADRADAKVGNLTLRPGQIVLFENGFINDAPDKNRPTYYGWVNPTDGTPVLQAGVWLKKFDDGRAYLSGSTQYPLPDKPIAKQEAEPEVARTAIPTTRVPTRKAAGGRA